MQTLAVELAVPDDLSQRKLPLLSLHRSETLYRIQAETYADPLYFGATRLNRWDCPADANQSFGVLYTALEPKGAFYETLGHNIKKQIFSDLELAERTLWSIEIQQPLELVDLTGDGLAQLQIDARLTTTRILSIPQAWSLAFYRHPRQPDGIRYLSRHQPQLHCAALFERAKTKLQVGKPENLRYWQHPVSGETAVDYIEARGGMMVIESLLK